MGERCVVGGDQLADRADQRHVDAEKADEKDLAEIAARPAKPLKNK